MVGFLFEPFRLGVVHFAYVFIWGQSAQGLEPSCKVISVDEVGQMGFELFVALIVIVLDGRVLDGAVHALDLAFRPRVEDGMNIIGHKVDKIAQKCHGGHFSRWATTFHLGQTADAMAQKTAVKRGAR